MTSEQAVRRSPQAGILIGVGMGALMLVICLGSFVAFQAFVPRGMRDAEARTNLKAAFVAEKEFFDKNGRYSESIEEIGFLPSPGNRYRYLLSTSGDPVLPGHPDGGRHTGVLPDPSRATPPASTLLAGIPAVLLREVGLKGACPDCDITIIAVGNIDWDADLDVWSVSTSHRALGGEHVYPGTPFIHVDDKL